MSDTAEIGYAEYAAAERRFMHDAPSWDELSPTCQGSWAAAAAAIAGDATHAFAKDEILANAGPEWDQPRAPETVAVEYVRHLENIAASAPPGDGQWMTIAFMGHVEVTGFVTEVTIGGQSAFHIDLPEKNFGGDPSGWLEYAATALYSRRPATEETARKTWEARRAREAAWAQWREDGQRAIGAGDDDQDEEAAF